jgi:adhesin transport system membrane fusion protein
MDGSRKILWASMAALALFLAWASFAEIDQLTRATGQIIASKHSQIIQSADGGMLEKLLVKEGDKVERGQLLAVLDKTRAAAAFMESQAKAYALAAQVARLRAEVFGGQPKFPPEVQKHHPEFVSNQKSLFERRQKAIREDLQALERSQALVKKELALNEPLLATGDVSHAEIIRLQRQVADIDGQLISRRNKYFQDAQADLAKAEEDLASVAQSSAQRKDSLDHTELRAPMAGLVKNIRFTTVGAVIKTSEEVMQIVPTDDDLLVEVRVRSQDVAHLKPGLPATVKIDAYDYTLYGTLNGTLTYLSPDTLNEGLKPNEQPYYRAEIRTAGHQFSGRPNDRIELTPGMTATVEIRTGENTVLRYLTKPVIKTVSESFHEK